jgi:hypothetical protein
MHSIISLIFEEFSIIQAAFNEILDVIIIITADELNYHIGRDEGFSLILATIDDQRDPHFRDLNSQFFLNPGGWCLPPPPTSQG